MFWIKRSEDVSPVVLDLIRTTAQHSIIIPNLQERVTHVEDAISKVNDHLFSQDRKLDKLLEESDEHKKMQHAITDIIKFLPQAFITLMLGTTSLIIAKLSDAPWFVLAMILVAFMVIFFIGSFIVARRQAHAV